MTMFALFIIKLEFCFWKDCISNRSLPVKQVGSPSGTVCFAISVAFMHWFAHARCGGGHGRGEQRRAVRSVELPGSGRRRAELQRRRHGHHPAETRGLRLVVGLAVRTGGFRPKQLLWSEEANHTADSGQRGLYLETTSDGVFSLFFPSSSSQRSDQNPSADESPSRVEIPTLRLPHCCLMGLCLQFCQIVFYPEAWQALLDVSVKRNWTGSFDFSLASRDKIGIFFLFYFRFGFRRRCLLHIFPTKAPRHCSSFLSNCGSLFKGYKRVTSPTVFSAVSQSK